MPQIVWITGGSSGIGAALAQEMARQGWIVAVSARSPEKLAALAGQSYGAGRIVAYPLDVLDYAATQETIERITREIGPIDLAVLSAGTYVPDHGQKLAIEGITEQFNLNVLATMNAVIKLIAAMKGRGRGQIAIISSVAGYCGLPRAVGYGGSKAALINMAEALQPDCAVLGIKLQVICPGFVKTPLTDKNTFPMPFLIGVDEAVGYILRGLRSSRFEIAFPGRMRLTMKLLKMVPYWLYLPMIRKATGVKKD